MIEMNVEINKKLINEMSKKSIILSALIGGVGMGAAIPLLVFILLGHTEIGFVIPFIITLSFGAIGVYNLVKVLQTNHKAEQAHAVLAIKISEKEIKVQPIKNGTKSQDFVIPFENVTSYKESKNYIFIKAGRKVSIPFNKDENYQKIID